MASLGDAHALFFLFLDDDPRRDHHHQAVGLAADADVLEQSIDVGHLGEERHAEFIAAFAQPLDAAQEHGSAVGHADRRDDRHEGERRQLDRDALMSCCVAVALRVVLAVVVVVGRAARAGRGSRSVEGEFSDVADLGEERHDGQPHVAAIVRDDGLYGHQRAFVEHDDDRLLGGGKFADDRDHADHERLRRRIGDERLLTVEERDLGRVEHVGAAIALGRFDQEVGLDVAEDREAEFANWLRIAEGRARQVETVLTEWHVQVGRKVWKRIRRRDRRLDTRRSTFVASGRWRR